MKVFRMARKRLVKEIGKYFPANAVRIIALRAASYHIGQNVYIGEELHITDELKNDISTLHIGDRVAIAQRVTIILSSHPNYSRLRPIMGDVVGHVRICDDAWIGAGAILLPNVVVGEGAVVGAGSVVTKPVPSRTVVAGNPARIIRSLDTVAL